MTYHYKGYDTTPTKVDTKYVGRIENIEQSIPIEGSDLLYYHDAFVAAVDAYIESLSKYKGCK